MEKVGGGDSGHSSGEESAWLNKQWEAPVQSWCGHMGMVLSGSFPVPSLGGPGLPVLEVPLGEVLMAIF